MWQKRSMVVLLMGMMLLPVGIAAPAHAASALQAPALHLGYGFMLAHTAHLDRVTNAGFDWFKYYANWEVVSPNRDRVYNWETVDWLLDDACRHGLHLLLRVGRSPSDWTPIRDSEMEGWEHFFRDLAAHIVQRRAACSQPYAVAMEIWNEPNLDFQWGHQPVDPARYTEMVRRAYRGVKAVAPDIAIAAGSLAPTGGLPDGRAMDDLEFLRRMYAAGLKGHFDAISIHNYGYGRPPDDNSGDGMNFRRAEEIYAVMVDHGDGDKTVWGTEFGWLLESQECNDYWQSIGFGWHQVSASRQADYLVRAFQYAEANWPWMELLIVSNLEFSVMHGWYQPCDPLRGFSVLNGDQTPRPAYTALAAMEKRPLGGSSLGMNVTPTSLSWMMPQIGALSVSRTVTVQNTGRQAFRWTATVDAGGLPITVSPDQGDGGDTFTVTVHPTGLSLGLHTAEIRVTADHAAMPGNPHIIPVQVRIVEHVHPVYAPVLMRAK